MKKILWLLVLILFYANLHSQILVRDSRVGIQKKAVVLYENTNYTGQSKALTPGQYQLSDFNDLASSIKVPAGMVAIIYEHGNNTMGYGRWVDLLEDCPDFSVYNFNDKTSYINIFLKLKDNTYEWARNANVNGSFVAGHWERKRARPLPPNTVAVVAPPIPAPLPTTPSVLVVNGPNTTISSLGIQTVEGRGLWTTAINDQMGVIGNDYRGIEELGSACFQRASNNLLIPDFFNFWYLQQQQRDHRSVKFFKRTLAGSVKQARQVHIDGTFEDYDVNIDIYPDPKYKYLITDAHKPDYTNLMKTQYYGSFTKSGESGCPSAFDFVEAEITEKYKQPKDNEARLAELTKERIGKKICVYGPWIWDEGHCCHPEIHPAEQVWWNEQTGNVKKYGLNVLCDASRRFWWRNQMDDGSKLKPWAEPPIKGLFAIAFEVNIPKLTAAAVGYTVKTFEVENIQHYNVKEFPNADQVYNLMHNGKPIVSFIPHNNAFKVSFEHVGIVPGAPDKIRGFLVIETSVGTTTQIATSAVYPLSNPVQIIKLPEGSSPSQAPQIMESTFFKKVEGHYLFNVTEKNISKGGSVMGMMEN